MQNYRKRVYVKLKIAFNKETLKRMEKQYVKAFLSCEVPCHFSSFIDQAEGNLLTLLSDKILCSTAKIHFLQTSLQCFLYLTFFVFFYVLAS